MKKKILLGHSHYGSATPSGEGQVFQIESDLLSQRGHQIDKYERFSDDILQKGHLGKIIGAFSTPWNPFTVKVIQKRLTEFKPDIVHIHNTFPLISPSIFSAIGTNAASVLTLHNYRLFCPAAIPMRGGKICTECIDKRSSLPSLKYGCYRQSRVATLPIALNVALHRNIGTWSRHVDAFITLTDFQKELMVKGGLPAALVHVKPNFFPGDPSVIIWKKRKPCIVFVGRLSAEKGIETLLRAWLEWGSSAPELKVIGDGDLKEPMMRLAQSAPDVPIRFLGQIKPEDAQNEIARASLLVLPSEWFEGFPMVIREAFAFGTPVAASDIGPLSSIITEGENGLLFSPGNVSSLVERVKEVWDSQGKLEQLSTGARQSFEDHYTEEKNYEYIMNIYQNAIEVNESRKT